MKVVRILTALFVTIFLIGYTLNSWTQELPSEIDLFNAEEFGVLSILGEEEGDVQSLKLATGDINGDGFDDVINILKVVREFFGLDLGEARFLQHCLIHFGICHFFSP